jgi:hypothetical protein
MQFGTGLVYKKLSRKAQFRENCLGGISALRKGLNEFAPVIPTFLDRFW